MKLLNIGNTVTRIENYNRGAFDIGKALKRRLSGVAGGCNEDTDLSGFTELFELGRQQTGQHLQCHILERAGGAVPQLQNAGIIV